MSIEHFGASTKAVAKYKKLHANEEPLGDDAPDDPGPDWHGKREGRPQKPAAGDTTWREWAERTKGSRAEMDAGHQHPGHTSTSWRSVPIPTEPVPGGGRRFITSTSDEATFKASTIGADMIFHTQRARSVYDEALAAGGDHHDGVDAIWAAGFGKEI